ncbi:MAG TPA: MBL fold metallo-hydrolase [Paracoccaceae bacterium]|nr:MBL fold metallo-hydrolase [Paracoccaceae bacterium]
MIRLALAALALVPLPALAAQSTPSHCIALSQMAPGLTYVALGETLAPDQVRVHFVGHATFLVETAGGVKIATDFTGYVGADVLPDVVTMNKAHTSHYTLNPDPRIPHVLHGWGPSPEAPADHYLELDDVIIRNVPTDIRGYGGAEVNGNSIFIFEVAGLCIGHLGHLHHVPSEAQYAAMGRLDVVMAPVDGGYTMPLRDMISVLKTVKARWVLPMHWFGRGNLEVFLAGMADEFQIERRLESSAVFTLQDLPREPTVLVLEPGFLDRYD